MVCGKEHSWRKMDLHSLARQKQRDARREPVLFLLSAAVGCASLTHGLLALPVVTPRGCHAAIPFWMILDPRLWVKVVSEARLASVVSAIMVRLAESEPKVAVFKVDMTVEAGTLPKLGKDLLADFKRQLAEERGLALVVRCLFVPRTCCTSF